MHKMSLVYQFGKVIQNNLQILKLTEDSGLMVLKSLWRLFCFLGGGQQKAEDEEEL